MGWKVRVEYLAAIIAGFLSLGTVFGSYLSRLFDVSEPLGCYTAHKNEKEGECKFG